MTRCSCRHSSSTIVFLRRVPFDSPFAATVALGACWRFDLREIESRWSVGGEPSVGSINDAADHCGIDVLDGVNQLSVVGEVIDDVLYELWHVTNVYKE